MSRWGNNVATSTVGRDDEDDEYGFDTVAGMSGQKAAKIITGSDASFGFNTVDDFSVGESRTESISYTDPTLTRKKYDRSIRKTKNSSLSGSLFWSQRQSSWPQHEDRRIELTARYFTVFSEDKPEKHKYKNEDLKTSKKLQSRFEKTIETLGCRDPLSTSQTRGIELDTKTASEVMGVLESLKITAVEAGVLDFAGSIAKQATFTVYQPPIDSLGQTMVKRLVQDLGYQPPRLVISMSGASVANEEFSPIVRKILKNGFSETSDTWIVTSGLNAGVSKLAAEVAAEVRSSPGFNQAALPVIAISRDPSKPKTTVGYYRYLYESRLGSDLEPSHNHFFLIRCPPIEDADKIVGLARDDFEDALKGKRSFKDLLALQDNREKLYPLFGHTYDEEDDAFLRLATRVNTLQLVVGGDDHQSAEITLQTVLTAVRDPETISPVVLLEGTGGITDVLAYAWRLLNDTTFESARYSEETLDRMVRKVFQLYGSKAGVGSDSDQLAENLLKNIMTAVAVSDKVHVFPIDSSDGADLDTAMLRAIMANSRPRTMGNTKDATKAELDNLIEQYQMHLNMVIMAMSMARTKEFLVEIDKARSTWDEIEERLEIFDKDGLRLRKLLDDIEPYNRFVFKALEWALVSAPAELDVDHATLVMNLVDKIESIQTAEGNKDKLLDRKDVELSNGKFGLPALLYEKRLDANTVTIELLYKALYQNEMLPHMKKLLKYAKSNGKAENVTDREFIKLKPSATKEYEHMLGVWNLIVALFYDAEPNRMPSLEAWNQYANNFHSGGIISEADLATAGHLLACQELMIWAILAKQPALAEYFWQKGGHSIANALVASQICTAMCARPELKSGRYTHIVNEYTKMAAQFENHAISLLANCYNRDTDLTMLILNREVSVFQWLKIDDADFYDCLELAQLANDKDFISDPACQSLIDSAWNLKGTTKNRGWLPTIYGKAQAPVCKFYVKFLFYVLLLGLYTSVALTEIKYDSGSGLYEITISEWILAFWFFVACVDEIFELLKDGLNIKALKVYLNIWNLFDLIMYAVFWLAFAIRYTSEDNEAGTRMAKAIYGINIMIGYFRVYQFLYISPSIGPKIEIFLRLFQELIQFLLLILLFVASYGIFVQTVHHPFTPYDENTMLRVVYRPYFQIFGELMLDDLAEETDCIGTTIPFSGCGDQNPGALIVLITAVYLIFTSIMLLNMLIAGFTNVYEQVSVESTKIYRMTRFKMLLENGKNSTLLPVPLNAPILVWNFIRLLNKFVRKKMSSSTTKQKDLLSSFVVANDLKQNQAEELQERESDLYVDELKKQNESKTETKLEFLTTKINETSSKVDALKGSLNIFYQQSENSITTPAMSISELNALLHKRAKSPPSKPTSQKDGPYKTVGFVNQWLIHVVTRWKRDAGGNRIFRKGKPVAEFVAVKRNRELDKWALPELQYQTQNREPSESPAIKQAFGRHNLMSHISRAEKDRIAHIVQNWLIHDQKSQENAQIFEGNVIDEDGVHWVKVEHFHDDGNLFDAYMLSAAKPPEAVEVSWITVSKNIIMCGSQSTLIHMAATQLKSYW